MKTDIHPTYNDNVDVTCACGQSFSTGSTAKELSVEVCSKCHPFYTGKKKLVDVAGRVDRFKQKLATSKEQQAAAKDRGEKPKNRDKADDNTVKLN